MSLLEGIADLHRKYVEMLAMRLADETLTGAPHGEQVRARMSALAARFPGALREIDELELAEIRRRIGKLDSVVAGASDVELWMEAMALFHQFARGALWAKRWLKGRQSVTPEIEAEYALEAGALDLAGEALSWRAELAVVARPPDGRVTGLVYARVARALGVTEADARRLVLGEEASARRRRGRGRRSGRGGGV